MKYAAYGSNMNIEQMATRCPCATKIGTGIINEYELVFCRVATIQPRKENSVPVVLWEITESCEKRLDIYEGYPHLYIKKNLVVKIEREITDEEKPHDTFYKTDFESELVEAMVYIMAEPHCSRSAPPSDYYLQTIVDGYRQNNIEQQIRI